MFIESNLSICAERNCRSGIFCWDARPTIAKEAITLFPIISPRQCRHGGSPSAGGAPGESASTAEPPSASQRRIRWRIASRWPDLYGLDVLEYASYTRTSHPLPGHSERWKVGASGHDKTSIMFSVQDRVGALHDMLMPFKHHHINMTRGILAIACGLGIHLLCRLLRTPVGTIASRSAAAVGEVLRSFSKYSVLSPDRISHTS